MQSLIEEKIAAVEQRKDDAKRLNKRFTMEMNVHMAHMFQVATEQAANIIRLSVWNWENLRLSLTLRR